MRHKMIRGIGAVGFCFFLFKGQLDVEGVGICEKVGECGRFIRLHVELNGKPLGGFARGMKGAFGRGGFKRQLVEKTCIVPEALCRDTADVLESADVGVLHVADAGSGFDGHGYPFRD